MLAIKLSRIGKKRQASYRIIVKEKRSRLGGRVIEDLGWYNPKDKKFKVNAERVKYWIKSGAQPTASMHNLLVRAKVLEAPKIPVHKKSKQETPTEAATPVAA